MQEARTSPSFGMLSPSTHKGPLNTGFIGIVVGRGGGSGRTVTGNGDITFTGRQGPNIVI